ncbi:hypothetical protein WCLP8_360004 [uncultured Gammaproteobacteria bacterium]
MPHKEFDRNLLPERRVVRRARIGSETKAAVRAVVADGGGVGRGNRYHDSIRDRISALPLSPAKRGVAVMVLMEVIRWVPAPGAACGKTVAELAQLLCISQAETIQALNTLHSINAARLVNDAHSVAIHVAPLGAGISPAKLKERISYAISCHSAWKTRLRLAIEAGAGGLVVEDIVQDDRCAFGQWLHGPDFAQIGDDSDYQLVLYLHAQFHKVAAEIYALAKSGNVVAAKRAMGAGGAFAAISLRLVKSLTAWRRSLP